MNSTQDRSLADSLSVISLSPFSFVFHDHKNIAEWFALFDREVNYIILALHAYEF